MGRVLRKSWFRAIVLWFLAVSGGSAAELDVATFNAGLLRVLGKDLVPCVEGRRKALPNAIGREFIRPGRPFVLLLQGVWDPADHAGLVALARREKLRITDRVYVPRRGLVVISSEPILEQSFVPFSCDAFSPWNRRGVLVVRVSVGGSKVTVMNTHTAYGPSGAPGGCHQRQLREIAALATNPKFAPPPAVLGGDFNAGANLHLENERYDPVDAVWKPFVGRLNPRWLGAGIGARPEERAGGWAWKEADLGPLDVTWDTNFNPLVSKPAMRREEKPSTPDHIFISPCWSEYAGRPEARILFGDPVPVSFCRDHEVEKGKTFLSDHYGVRTTLTLE